MLAIARGPKPRFSDFKVIRTAVSRLWRLFPPGPVKNRVGCAIYNLKQRAFRMRFEDGHYVVAYPTFDLRFVSNPYHLLKHNEEYTRFYQPKAGDIVVDAGAFVGTFGLFCAKLVGSGGKVFCFEPDPANYRELCQNIQLNGVSNVTAIPKGLWSSETVLSFRSDGSVGSSFVSKEGSGALVEIPVTTIDDLAEREGLDGVDFIKMDIEGAEIEAITGARRCLGALRTHLAIASYHIVDGKQTYMSVEPQLAAIGIEPRTIHGLDIVTYADPPATVAATIASQPG